MLTKQQYDLIQSRTRIAQIIWFALFSGVVIAATVMYFVREPPKMVQTIGPMAMIGLAMGVSYLASLVVPKIVSAKAQEQFGLSDSGVRNEGPSDSAVVQALNVIQSSMITGLALVEGGAFANVMFWFMEGSVANLAMIGVGLVFLLFRLPTVGKSVSQVEALLDRR